jgi:hypothetical protein
MQKQPRWIDRIRLSKFSIDFMNAFILEVPLHKAAQNHELEVCQELGECAQEYRDDWRAGPGEVYSLTG